MNTRRITLDSNVQGGSSDLNDPSLEHEVAFAALELVDRPVLLIDADARRVAWCNSTATEVLQEPAASMTWGRLGFTPEVDPGADGPWVLNLQTPSGASLMMRANGRRIERNGRRLWVIVLQPMAADSMTDPLTGLPNRAALDQQMAVLQQRREAGAWAMAFIDLNDFKRLNDALGHAAGDAALQEVARRLKQALREQDLLVRWAGDEFVILAPWRGGRLDAVHWAKRIQTALQPPIRLSAAARAIQVSASIGIAIQGGEFHSDDLFAAADAAMYRAKSKALGFDIDVRSPNRPR